ncbi:hypothetical protein M406DRAFT_332550 [Cryphonectria parasitica EP155]|uniref:Uncharacterized protein n=1 Tax=Cryphonectria parasitica (strain ATCC 38755 / EP155) TaxID=660469 RepID=A0A9P4XWP5_CRYP1|nr:uncharacterized protein M406DRAFT_332550 [Cryphonectria parasitica EP155]KAF3762160.1 hypothetical protein M406DRAFT_332550 [Cryphonectria parasitica EP155]
MAEQKLKEEQVARLRGSVPINGAGAMSGDPPSEPNITIMCADATWSNCIPSCRSGFEVHMLIYALSGLVLGEARKRYWMGRLARGCPEADGPRPEDEREKEEKKKRAKGVGG